jgi:UDP-N-acetylmuramate dehydrogenase
MSLIPGNVELPRTKYRAYGTEIKDTFISCEALTTINHELKTFTKEDCHFGYRKVSSK